MTASLPDVWEFIAWMALREQLLLAGRSVSRCYSHSGDLL